MVTFAWVHVGILGGHTVQWDNLELEPAICECYQYPRKMHLLMGLKVEEIEAMGVPATGLPLRLNFVLIVAGTDSRDAGTVLIALKAQ